MPTLHHLRLPYLVVALAVPLTAALAEQAPNTLSEAEKRAGWRLLFDGTSAAAFRNYRQDSLGAGWQVRDGAVVRTARGAGDIVTRDQFESFELQLEYRIAPGGNSGIMFHVTEEEDAAWKTGPEVQVLDNAAGTLWAADVGQDPSGKRWTSSRRVATTAGAAARGRGRSATGQNSPASWSIRSGSMTTGSARASSGASSTAAS